MAHLLTHDPTSCGVGTLHTNSPPTQDCSSATLACVSTLTANGTVTRGGRANLLCVANVDASAMKSANAQANLLCVANVDASAMKTVAGVANLLCVANVNAMKTVSASAGLRCIANASANGGKFKFGSARITVRSGIFVGRTTITRIIHGPGKPANACAKSGGSIPRTGGSTRVPKLNSSTNVPTTGGTTNIPKTGGTVNVPKVNSAKPIVLRINNGRKC